MSQINKTLNRRRFIAGLTSAMGASFVSKHALAVDAALAYQSGSRASIMTASQLELVKQIGEIIIPETDTPGAIAADVHGYIDYMLADFMTEDARNNFLVGLEKIDAQAGGFLKLTADKQQAFVAHLDKAAYSRDGKKTHADYRALKSWVTTGFFTSEAGMTEAGIYRPLPGPLREVTRQEWLTHNGWAEESRS